MSVLQKLTEGIVDRDLQREGTALLEKWEKTGLLEGITGDSQKNGMARLLENQAKELLREASSMAAGDVEGFAAVAFPLVRRVFGSLIANDLVSVQPMSLPSGLIFFLDFTHEKLRGGHEAGSSLYGGGRVASQVTGGVNLTRTADGTNAVGAYGQGGDGLYNLASGYSSPTGSVNLADREANNPSVTTTTTGLHDVDSWTTADAPLGAAGVLVSSLSEGQKKMINFDPDILARTTDYVGTLVVALTDADMANVNTNALHALYLGDDATSGVEAAFTGAGTTGTGAQVVRRLTKAGYVDSNGLHVTNSEQNHFTFVMTATDTFDGNIGGTLQNLHYLAIDDMTSSDAAGSVVGQDQWGLEEPSGGTGNAGSTTSKNEMAEIDIKVDSVAVTAITKKLKAKWTPELGQDLNAYHNLDAEVELTSILSEQIALEIDREILSDLVNGAKAGTFYWSRSPGLFVKKDTGVELGASSAAPDFTGTVSEWYETLCETINDISAQIHRKTLRGGANFVVCGPEVANILEFTSGFRADVTGDVDRGSAGTVKTGAISKKWDVYVDPYFPRNTVLVGRKGGSFLESGYVYAPYVPLQVTPTIFGIEDFVPRKGVMTRYAKKMVRPDMYGLVIVRGLLGEEGSS